MYGWLSLILINSMKKNVHKTVTGVLVLEYDHQYLLYRSQRKFDEREAKLKSLSANIKASMAAKDPGR